MKHKAVSYTHLDVYKRQGTALVDTCGKLLDKAELEVVKLMKTADGTPAETEYERDDV